ncbi:BCCT family transporter [Corynebacterium aquilae]|uniref:Glycine/betaine ABC transporter n=1 Tax=Corynebacterium aquilae DSM 44791 TaxID=1431546 RepID=A0A1L7CER0_9CORY|nr:BCCT family transporter [Corynebacterium aquilae]APT84360.1 glycine/betaine ABC transporter [Corynebacterium aquilae DSM 44791]
MQQLAVMLENHEEIPDPVEEEVVLDGESDSAPLNLGVVIPAMAVVLAVVVWGLFGSESFSTFASNSLGFVVDTAGWAFVLFGTIFVFFIFAIALSRFGTIRLGRDDEAPEFSTVSWIAMMFAAGMGIGLMFYGTTEPLTHYRNGVPGHAEREVGTAFATTLFHWTLHPWSVYAIVGLSIAYSTFRIGRKQLLSAAFVPLIGEKGASGPLGTLIDVLAIVATVFGTAASLGIGAVQIGAGLEAAGIVEDPSSRTILTIVLILTLAFLISAMSGVGKGIQYVSNANMVLASILAIFVFVLGPTVTVLNMLPTAIGNYLQTFFEMAARTADSADGTAGEWLSGWTIFYWAWWISWSPFVGMFLARISRGRTIREFIVGVTLVPAAVTVVWFSIFGGTAIHLEQVGESIWGDGDSKAQLFDLLHTMPGGKVAGFVAMILLATFFITSADSASTVMGSMSQNGRLEANRWITAAWGVLTAAIGLTLLISGGDDALNNLQNVTIIAASPFLLVIIGLMFALVKGLSDDPLYLDHKAQQKFAMKLARERRIHAEHARREARKAAHHHERGHRLRNLAHKK